MMVATLAKAWLQVLESSAVNPGADGATPVPSALQNGHRAVASFLIEVQMQQPQILVPVSGHS
jgi:hypothetical protein